MLCQKCGKNPATVYYKQNINGTVREIALCEQCADALGGYYSAVPDTLNIFGSLFGKPVQNNKNKLYSTKVCSLCGSTFQDLINSGKAGCAKCYEVFRDELAPTITNIHGKTKHIGRIPNNKVQSLKSQLKTAIDSEDFEKAAKLRDEIRKLNCEGDV